MDTAKKEKEKGNYSNKQNNYLSDMRYIGIVVDVAETCGKIS